MQLIDAHRQNAHLYDELASGESLYNYFRDYNPKTGKYIESDPIGLAGGINAYVYVDNQPTMQTDPLGLMGSRGNPAVHSGSGQDGIGQTTGALGDFARNYQNMRDANTIGSDKYFHCMANCQAARQGSIGSGLSRAISEARELTDEYIKGDSAQACNDDRNANNTGRNGGNNNPGLPCSSVCGGYRPNGLPSKY